MLFFSKVKFYVIFAKDYYGQLESGENSKDEKDTTQTETDGAEGGRRVAVSRDTPTTGGSIDAKVYSVPLKVDRFSLIHLPGSM